AFNDYLNALIFEEVIPTIDLPKDELKEFADAVFERFGNPFIKHRLLDISLNSVSKYTARCLPSLIDYVEEKKELPKRLTFALAALLKFYDVKKDDEGYYGIRENGDRYPVKDDAKNLEFFENLWKEKDSAVVAQKALENQDLWQRDLTLIPNVVKQVATHLENMSLFGVQKALKSL
ncbi:MAG: tagaturonate reductase, partial [Clostridium sp.]|nr:tagaturonate reductase [Clostridium sp.]